MSFKHWLSPSVPPLFYYNVYRLSFFEKCEYRSVGYHYTNQKICVHRLVLTPTVIFHTYESFGLCWNSAYKKKSNYHTHIHMRRFHDIILPIYGGISRIINRETHVFHLNQIIQNGFQTDQFSNPFQYKIPGHSSLNDIRSQLKIMKLLWPAVLYWKSLINWSNTCNSCKIQ